MTTAIENLLTKLAVIERTIAGVVEAHVNPPENLFAFPSFINYFESGETTSDASLQMMGLYTIVCEAHLSRAILPEATALATPLINLFEDAIYTDPTLGGNVMTVNAIRIEFGTVPYGTETHLGIRFRLDLKMRRLVGGTTP